RSIILCFDGTSNHFSNQNTNVVKMVELLKKDDPAEQMAGVGTYAPPGLLTSVGLNIAAKADEGVAWSDSSQSIIWAKQVPFAYQIYEASEEREPPDPRKAPEERIDGPGAIDVFAGRDNKQSGKNILLLELESIRYSNPSLDNMFTLLTYTVKESARPENVDPERFKIAFCIPIQIKFLGVWDTVGSVGALKRKTLPWIEYNPSVQYFRQALALDETRGNFIPSVWDHSRTKKDLDQSSLEVWFKGGHADIGGGAEPSPVLVKDGRPVDGKNLGLERSRLLSNITLRWMVDQCLKSPSVRILFDPDSMRRYRRAKILEERAPGLSDEQIQERIADLDDFDVIQEPWIALEKSSFWWFLECLPVPKLSQVDRIRSQPKTVKRHVQPVLRKNKLILIFAIQCVLL
ncbi:unnamed protein product, partial [Rhizoctonia solani]